jgi:hypothetical protein
MGADDAWGVFACQQAASICNLSTQQRNSWPIRGPTETPTSNHIKPKQIELPNTELLGFRVADQVVSYTYSFKNLKAAFANIPSNPRGETGSVSTKARLSC